MYGSGSGPLGALLVIVPLAAIPVFAIVGVPHFAPLVASPSDDDDDLIADAGDAEATQPPASAEAPRKGRTADDLFAPISNTRPRSEADGVPPADGRPPADQTPGGDRPRPLDSLPPPEALDQWEVRLDAADIPTRPRGKTVPAADGSANSAGAGPSESLQIPADDDGKVATEGFNPELLILESGNLPDPDVRGAPPRQADASGGNRPVSRNREMPSDQQPLGTVESRPPTSPDQFGWQAATRRLKELGINKYRLDAQIEKQTFAFICTISTPDNPRVSRRFEAEADDPLEAVQLAIKQIDEWRSRDSQAQAARRPADEN